ncbi:chymotrypsin-1-like [Toxorhynchites rutilus septentrionalis]|uniref:chymotrypsin-1-like n=1 Tax=Toxorhynchites rutilus septentrionalis TaxID=329112 RepID=UPI00247B07AF|nr:chymotrypsin-1-like [Toxorhynchites rutilus septentrionalis]
MKVMRSLSLVGVLTLCSLAATVNGDEQSKVVGGQRADERIPYQISLQVMINSFYGFGPKTWAHNCGGSIIAPRYVISAAHCLDDIEASRLSIVSGTNDLRNDGSKGTRHMVEWYKIHEDYIELNRSDIGIIRVDEPFVFNDSVQPIKYSDNQVGGGETCLLTGWGYTMPIRIGRTPSDLQKAELVTITNEECRARSFPVNPTEMCTFTRIGQGACGGDSGGPLVCNNELAGVVSYGTRFCGIGSPDVFTRVSEFKSWIDANQK